MNTRWEILSPDERAVSLLTEGLNCSRTLGAILVNRSVSTLEKARFFLTASLGKMRPPFSMKDMDKAVTRIKTALDRGESILVFGDYDVDGVTGTTVLYEFLKIAGARVAHYIPHRTREGYGLQKEHITEVAQPQKISLIITVDCGSSSHEAVKAAKESGIDVIITDHHKISRPPEAVAVVNPSREDCPSCMAHLAGVGVVFYVVISLRTHLRETNFWKSRPEPNLKAFCDLVALGTVADMVPLVEENRILSQTGIGVINTEPRPGVEALLKISGIREAFADSQDISFRLAPRINAAGRMDHANLALKLLTTKNRKTAREIAEKLNNMNLRRQEIEKTILDGLLQTLEEDPGLPGKHSLVMADPDWHPGILGIVAARIVKKLHIPVILISTEDGMGKGSARSIPGVDLHEGIKRCSGLLEAFGGHAMAAGVKIKTENIDLFRKKFEKVMKDLMGPGDFSRVITIDKNITLRNVTAKLLDELESLKPFGQGNPEPLFMAENVRVVSSKIVGKNHRKMVLGQPVKGNNKTVNAIQFNLDRQAPLPDHFERIAFRLQWNHWNGRRTPQIVVEET